MLSTEHRDGPLPKNVISLNHFPVYIHNEQPPTRKEPFRIINDFAVCHTLSIVASSAYTAESLQQVLQSHGTLHYAKVYMKLIDIISGDFFNEYIKSGNILMLSEGRPGIDDVISLREGVLRLEVDKPTFERLGLDGKVIQSPGRKHTKARYAIELDLRSPSMVRGKKGFERVIRAFENVLVNTQTWLFYNVKAPTDFSGPITAFTPIERDVTPTIHTIETVIVPSITLDEGSGQDEILDLQEWLSLAALDSPRLQSKDNINYYLSRYQPPSPADQHAISEAAQTSTIRVLRWRGLILPGFVLPLTGQLLKIEPSNGWIAISAHGFDGQSYTIIKKDKTVAVLRYMD